MTDVRVFLTSTVLLLVGLAFAVMFFRTQAAESRAVAAQAEMAAQKQEADAANARAESMAQELIGIEQRMHTTDLLLAEREQQKAEAEKKASVALKKYRDIVRSAGDACTNATVDSSVLGWLRDNTH